MNNYFVLFLKGIAVGIANIIPGVSGGTIALITGIFENIINSIKSFNIHAFKLLFSGKFKEFIRYTNLYFLMAVFGGAFSGIFALSFVLGSLFETYPKFVWAFFFGLILASVFFVAKKIKKWNTGVIISLLIGTLIAVLIINVFDPATEDPSYFYLFICGIVATCSMILPGLSGSFVLILMGNYELVMIRSVKTVDLHVLVPLMIGAVFGLIAFSHMLSWVFKKYKDQTIAILSGFILGSLTLLWPWKTEIIKQFGDKIKVIGYNYSYPSTFSFEEIFAVSLMIVGYILIWILEKYAVEE
ncbi:MAG: DUF368 domain-containing protein [Candidatus Delongbacteria bacterium]|nr:DUF368 domain-containing protein [Candidatus Delongbacteria bacterium]